MKTRRGRAGAITAETAAEAIREAAEHFQEPTRTALVEFLQLLSDAEPEYALRCATNAAGTLFQLSEFQQSIFLSDASSLAGLTRPSTACAAASPRTSQPASSSALTAPSRCPAGAP